jgi:ATP-binding cassette subfamily B protein
VFIGTLMSVALPTMIADLINAGIAGTSMGYLVRQGLFMLAVVAAIATVTIFGQRIATKASILFAADVRGDVFRKIQYFSYADIDKFSTGSLVTRMTNDTAQIQRFSMQILRMGVRSPTQLVGALIMAFAINGKLALVILAVIPVLAFTIGFIIHSALPLFQRMQNRIDHLNVLVDEAMTNVRVIKSFVRGDYESKRFDRANTALLNDSLKANRMMLFQQPGMTLAMNLTTMAILWFGGGLIIHGQMLVGDLTAFITYVTQILTSLNVLSNVLISSSRAIVSAERINQVLDTRPDITDSDNSDCNLAVTRGSVQFSHVTFRYYKNSRVPVLDDISFSIEPGQTVGVLGSTGSGKTTLVHLIPRLMDVDAGTVFVDGEDVRKYKLQNLRDGIAVVLQNNLLFSGSIRENLEWGDENATDGQIYAAAENAQAGRFVKDLKDGYETELGQGGINLSGGQKQRICIARALLKRAHILILDDSTSAVDSATEARIREHLDHDLPGVTKIVITQRVADVADADKILVLDNGKLVGEGAHAEMLAHNSVYQEICDSQQYGVRGASAC